MIARLVLVLVSDPEMARQQVHRRTHRMHPNTQTELVEELVWHLQDSRSRFADAASSVHRRKGMTRSVQTPGMWMYSLNAGGAGHDHSGVCFFLLLFSAAAKPRSLA